MGRNKGGENRKWTNEERLRYVLMCEEQHIPVRKLARDFDIPYGTLDGWIRKYRIGGIEAINSKRLRTGNRFAAIHTSKSLSEEDRLRLMVEKLEIENERLKKGYIVKGVGACKEFVTLNEWNTR
ncbi:MAG: helix-turn-helix domain-containing protein [Clostridiales bacterium]|nr:helix-turn-helix domain-containing protein [Clostridiales bacterium]